jgi:hypothetical protein
MLQITDYWLLTAGCLLETSREAVPWHRRLAAGLSQRSPAFGPRSIHVGFVVDKMALGLAFLRVLQFSPVNIIPPSFSIIVYHPRQWQQFRDVVSPHRNLQSIARELWWVNQELLKLRRGSTTDQ